MGGTLDLKDPQAPSEQTFQSVELQGLERQLKDWFLTRRVLMERQLSIKKLFKTHSVTGLTGTPPPEVPPRERRLWADLVEGRPELEDKLSINAKEMKADMYESEEVLLQWYLSIFRTSSDLDHPCRPSGVDYLTCLKHNYHHTVEERTLVCNSVWKSFHDCRSKLIEQQRKSLSNSLEQQKISDEFARKLWLKRAALMQHLQQNKQSLQC